ncbi:hypothetical protein ACQQZK_004569, partial [Escherichia coli]
VFFILLLPIHYLSSALAGDNVTRMSKCYSIVDPDYRALCRAKAHQESSICYAIQRNDIRAQCLAENK